MRASLTIAGTTRGGDVFNCLLVQIAVLEQSPERVHGNMHVANVYTIH